MSDNRKILKIEDRNPKPTLLKRVRSFLNAFRGLALLLKKETHARIHLAAAVLVIAAGFYFGISRTDWMAILLSIGMVFSAEAFNSALEELADRVSSEREESIRRTKDLSAGAVLLTAIVATLVGVFVFLPEFL